MKKFVLFENAGAFRRHKPNSKSRIKFLLALSFSQSTIFPVISIYQIIMALSLNFDVSTLFMFEKLIEISIRCNLSMYNHEFMDGMAS